MRYLLYIILIATLGASASLSAETTIKFSAPGGNTVVVSSPYTDFWEYADSGTIWTLEKKNNHLVFKKNGSVSATGTFKGNKLKMNSSSGKLFLTLKTSSEKLKFSFDETGNEWEFKQTSDKIKVRFDGIEYGKVKYYPDTGKIKAKNKNGATVSEVKHQSRISMFPGVFLVNTLPDDKSAFLVLLIISIAR